LSGTPPFNGETLPQLVAAILSEPPGPIRERRPEIPAELEAVLLRCLEKDRDRRYQSIGAMAQALVNFASRRSRHTAERIIRLSGLDVPGSQREPTATGNNFPTTGGGHPSGMTAPMAIAPTGARTNTSWTDTNRGAPQGRTAALVFGGLALAGVLGGGAFFALRGHASATGETAPSAEPPPANVAPADVAPAAPPEIAPLVPEPAPTPAPEPSAATSAAMRPPGSRPAPRPSAAPAPPAASAPAPATPTPPPPSPAPAKTKSPLSIELK
jgi:serine/threonine-protein kinase